MFGLPFKFSNEIFFKIFFIFILWVCFWIVQGMGGSCYFSMAQWQELELQALIFRHMLAGAAVPPELLHLLKKSLILTSPSPYYMPHPLQHYSHYQPACKFSVLLHFFFIFSRSYWHYIIISLLIVSSFFGLSFVFKVHIVSGRIYLIRVSYSIIFLNCS